MSNENGPITKKQLNAVADEVVAFELAKKAGIDELGPRRKKAEAKLADAIQALAEAHLSTETGDAIEQELAILRQQRTTEIGTAVADKRKANTTKIDAAIKATEAERVMYMEAFEVAKAARPILEERITTARQHLSNEIEAINKEVKACEAAISEKWAELERAGLRFALNAAQRSQAAKVVSRHFELATADRYWTNTPTWAEIVTNDVQWRGDVKDRYLQEVERLDALGLPAVREYRKPDLWQSPNPTGWRTRPAGVYDAHGQQIG